MAGHSEHFAHNPEFDLINRFIFDSSSDEEEEEEVKVKVEDVWIKSEPTDENGPNSASLQGQSESKFGEEIISPGKVRIKEEKIDPEDEDVSNVSSAKLVKVKIESSSRPSRKLPKGLKYQVSNSDTEIDEDVTSRGRRKRGKLKHNYNVVTYDKFKVQHPEAANAAFGYRLSKIKYGRNIHICGQVVQGLCHYMSYCSSMVHLHIKRNHLDASTIEIFKVIDFPECPANGSIYYNTTLTFRELRRKKPDLARPILRYHRQVGRNVHLCSLVLVGRCRFFSALGRDVFRHINAKHENENVSNIKIVGYPVKGR